MAYRPIRSVSTPETQAYWATHADSGSSPSIAPYHPSTGVADDSPRISSPFPVLEEHQLGELKPLPPTPDITPTTTAAPFQQLPTAVADGSYRHQGGASKCSLNSTYLIQ